MNQYALDLSISSFPIFPDHSTYIDYCLEEAGNKLNGYDTISDLEHDLEDINAYPHLDRLEDPKNLLMLDENTLNQSDYLKVCKCILDGRLFVEHFAAGEATRLNLGPKYLINIPKDLSIKKITALMNQHRKELVSEEQVRLQSGCEPSGLLPLSLGTRHMLQYSYDIYCLARSMGFDPLKILAKQKMLVVLNETSAETIIEEFISHKFYGYAKHNVFFMIQEAYHGINFQNKEIFYDLQSPKRLHNHGHIAIEQTMFNQIFHICGRRKRVYLTCEEFGSILKNMEIKVSYNIEDLDYLTGAVDNEGIALALKKKTEHYNMLMEVVPNNANSPQKGGMAAFDPLWNQDVMIESFQLKGIENHQIRFLNKNINYYPNPFIAWEMVKTQGLKMHMAVKNGLIYFQPVAGDTSFLVKTLLFMRRKAAPINAWKTVLNTPMAIKSFHRQDKQKGFGSFAKLFINS